jgi:hypothetical protein
LTSPDTPSLRVRIDAASGRLLEYTVSDAVLELNVSAHPAGEMTRRTDALVAAAPREIRSESPQALQEQIQFISSLLVSLPLSPSAREELAPWARLGRAAGPLARLLGPLATEARRWSERMNTPTTGPAADFANTAGADDATTTANPMAWMAMLGGDVANASAPRGSWACTVIRESAMLRAGELRSAAREVARLEREKLVGPVAALAIARSPLAGRQTAVKFAEAALNMNEPAAFVDDLRFLVDGNTPLSRGVLGCAAELGRMNAADVRTIAETLQPIPRKVLERLADALKRRAGDPADKVILDTMAQLWRLELHQPIELSLWDISRGRR